MHIIQMLLCQQQNIQSSLKVSRRKSNVAQYKSAADKESVSGNIAATKENLEKLYDELEHKRPAQGYESTRENMMSAVNNILAQANYVAECITDGIEYDADNVSTTIKSQISALIN